MGKRRRPWDGKGRGHGRRRLGAALQSRPGLTVLAGLLSNSLVFAAISFLQLHGWLDTVVSIGLPLLFTSITLPGIVGLSYLLGRKISRTSAPVAAALLGTAFLVALSAIPLAGLALYTLLGILAAGAALVSRFGVAPGHPPAVIEDTGTPSVVR